MTTPAELERTALAEGAPRWTLLPPKSVLGLLEPSFLDFVGQKKAAREGYLQLLARKPEMSTIIQPQIDKLDEKISLYGVLLRQIDIECRIAETEHLLVWAPVNVKYSKTYLSPNEKLMKNGLMFDFDEYARRNESFAQNPEAVFDLAA